MRLEKGTIVTFRTRGMQFRGGYIPKELTGRCMRVAPEGVYVTTGMAMWLIPVSSITDVRMAPPKVLETEAIAVGAA